MIVYKCKNCNGEMSVDTSGALYCEYCGTKNHFSDRELQGYKEFRAQMLNYLRALHDVGEDEALSTKLWEAAEVAVLEQEDGNKITIHYIYTSTEDHVTMYVTKSAVLYCFEQKEDAVKTEEYLKKLEFPPADIKGLQRCFPKLTGRYPLKNGGMLLAFAREASIYPLALFGALSPRHVAWIVSRMENIACVLEYNEMSHGKISAETIFINPKTHEAMLYGGWYHCDKKKLGIFGDSADLVSIRKTAKHLLGVNAKEVPEEFEKFLTEHPQKDAFEDFTRWDEVIEKGFGGRTFVKMNMQDSLNS